MEPKLNIDIFEGDKRPQFAIQFLSPYNSVNEAARIAELIDLDCPCWNLLPLLITLEDMGVKRGMQSLAQCVYIYLRIWARPSLEIYQNAILAGFIMVHLGYFRLEALSTILGANLGVLKHHYPHIETLMLSIDDANPEINSYSYTEIIAAHMKHSKLVCDSAKNFGSTIETSAQLLPLGQLTPQSLAAVAVLYSALHHGVAQEMTRYCQASGTSNEIFTGICDWVWCTNHENWTQTLGLERHSRDLWYPNLPKNIAALEQLCQKCGFNEQVTTAVKDAGCRLPITFFQRGLSLCSAAVVLAVTGQRQLPAHVLTETLWLSRWTDPQLQNYRKLIASYLNK